MTTAIGSDSIAAPDDGVVLMGACARQHTFDNDVLVFFAELLATVTLSVHGDDFEARALVAIKAKQQLVAALTADPDAAPVDTA